MCIYWRKSHTCSCASRVYLEMCHSALVSRTACGPISEDPILRPSYFQCYDCLREAARSEISAAAKAAEAMAMALHKAEEERKENVSREAENARKEKARRDAEAREQKARDEDAKRERDRKADIERQRREGGAWVAVDASTGRKAKGRKGAAAAERSTRTPASPNAMVAAKGVLSKTVTSPGGLKTQMQTTTTAVANVGVDPGGRAGRWGPAKKVVNENERPTAWKK